MEVIDTKSLIVFQITLLAMYSVWSGYMTLVEKVHALDKKVHALEQSLSKMEQANKLRLPYKAFEEIMNGMAALDVRDREVEFEKTVLDNARAHFSNALKVGTKREEE